MTWHVIRVRSKDAQKQLARTSLRDNLDVSEIIDIFTCEDIVSFKYQFLTTRYTTDFYIIYLIFRISEDDPFLVFQKGAAGE